MIDITETYIDEAIWQANAGNPADIPLLTERALSSNKVRCLLNWLCKLEESNYLEIGVHTGSTFIPALWNNPHTLATCIDKWVCAPELENAQRHHLEANLDEHLPGRKVNLIEGDLFTLDLDLLIPEVNIFFYDGPHTREGQRAAFVRYNPIFANRFIALVDDWNWEEPREETRRAFADLHYHVKAEWILPATPPRDEVEWWNGLFVAIVDKPDG